MTIHIIGGFNTDPAGDMNGLKALGLRLMPLAPVAFHPWNVTDLQLAPGDILIGHSYGGAQAVRIATQQPVDVPLLVGLDPVPHWDNGDKPARFVIPANVARAVCWRRLWPIVPPWSVKFADRPNVTNITVAASHNGLPSHPDIHDAIVDLVREAL